MRAHIRRHLTTIIVAFCTALLTAGGPPLAAAVFDADNARNADKVDNRHAVGADATASGRAGKLVATNASGRLPNSIIAKAPDADRLDGLNSTAFERPIARVVDIGSVGTPVQNGAALRKALADIPTSGAGAPSAVAPWLLHIGPGTFNLGGTTLQTRANVHVQGSGLATTLTCSCGGGSLTLKPTLRVAHPIEVRDVRVEATVSGDQTTATAVQVSHSARLVAVDAQATGGENAYGMVFTSGLGRLLNGSAAASSTQGVDVTGLWVNGGSVRAEGTYVNASGVAEFLTAIWTDSGIIEVIGARIFAPAGEALHRAGGDIRIATSHVWGTVEPATSPTRCRGAFDSTYDPLDNTCLPLT